MLVVVHEVDMKKKKIVRVPLERSVYDRDNQPTLSVLSLIQFTRRFHRVDYPPPRPQVLLQTT